MMFSTGLALVNGFLGGQGSIGQMILMMAIIGGIFYFLVIRPQQQQQQEHQDLIENLGSGDRIVTVGGIQGEITAVDDDTISLNVDDDVELTVSREKVAGLQKQDQEQDGDKDES
jgi:preprotein translocase subunit YajC